MMLEWYDTARAGRASDPIRMRRRWGFFYTPSTYMGKLATPGYCGTRVPVFPFLAIVVNQRLACYRSTVHTRYAASMQLRSLGTQRTRRAGSNSTRRSAAPHAVDLRSCRRSARFKHG
jgi:hypothetical protein